MDPMDTNDQARAYLEEHGIPCSNDSPVWLAIKESIENVGGKIFHILEGLFETIHNIELLIESGVLAPIIINIKIYEEMLGTRDANASGYHDVKKTSVPRGSDPLIFDLDGDGVETIGVHERAHFDYDGNGFAEQTGWASSDDGILVLDRNADGIINDGKELFGDQTILKNGRKAANGFEALADLDDNGDGKIDVNDAVYSQLRIWQDIDSDGVSSAEELFSLSDLSISSISVNSTISNITDANGNTQTRTGSYEKTDGTTAAIANVNFQRDTMYTIANEWLDVTDDIAALPYLQGSGNVYDLHQAMVRDTSGQLKSLVEQFVAAPDVATRNSLMEQILFKWTSSDTIDPTSRGRNIDARKLAVIENILSDNFIGTTGSNPFAETAAMLINIYNSIFEMSYAQLMQQTHLSELFNEMSYNVDDVSQKVRIDITDVITKLQTQLTNDYETGKQLLGEFTRTIRGFGSQDTFDYLTFRETFINMDPELGWVIDTGGLPEVHYPDGWLWTVTGSNNADAIRGILTGNGYIQGFNGDDVIYGTNMDETIGNGTGDAVLLGGGGSDVIRAGAGDDLIDGGEGNDTLYGQEGNDTYIFRRGYGRDTIIDTDNTAGNKDTIFFGGNLTPADILVKRSGNNLILQIKDTTDALTVRNYYLNNSTLNRIEQIKFMDGTVWDEAEIDRQRQIAPVTIGDDVIYGTDQNDILYGLEGNDAIYGLGGNDLLQGDADKDTLWGGQGDDTLVGGSGDDLLLGESDNDLLQGGDGNDTLYGGTGNDTLTGGAGNDELHGDEGNDTYLFGRGAGQDTVIDGDSTAGNLDAILLDAAVAPADVMLRRNGNHLVLSINSTTDILTVSNWFLNESPVNQVENIRFADGTIWDVPAIKLMVIQGTPNNDLLVGFSTADTIQGIEGNDTIYGQAGDDTLGGGLGNDTLYGEAGNDLLLGGDGTDSLYGGLGDDTLDGGAGNDYLSGISMDESYSLYGKFNGNDTYLFGRGSGQDVISDRDMTAGNMDTILFAADITPADIKPLRMGDDLVLLLNGTSDKLTVRSWFYDETGTCQIERIQFTDGTIWNPADIKQMVLQGTAGDDAITGYVTPDLIQGVAGNDNLYGRDGDDTLDGGAGNDQLSGEAGNDVLRGSEGNDILYGWQGDDTLDGGVGDDTLYGGLGAWEYRYAASSNGNDTYLFGRGSGHDAVMDWDSTPGNTDTILLNADITPADVKLSRNQNNLVLSINGTDDKLTVSNWFNEDAGEWQVENIRFADGTIWDVPTIKQMLLQGTPGNDVIYGYSTPDTIQGFAGNDVIYGNEGNDTLLGNEGNDNLYGGRGDDVLEGGTGNDYLYGGSDYDYDGSVTNGNDTYLFGRGSGQDTIIDRDATSGNVDTILLNSDITPADVLIQRLGDSLVLSVSGAEDTLTVGGWFDESSEYQVERIQFADGTVWNAATVAEMVLQATSGDDVIIGYSRPDTLQGIEGNDRLYGRGGDDVIDGGTGSDRLYGELGNDTLLGGGGNDTLYGGAGDDLLDGGAGDDRLYGDAGDDTYLFSRGSGQDTVSDWDATAGNLDTILLSSDINPADIVLKRDVDDLILTINGESDTLRVAGWFQYESGESQVERIQFADGTVWDAAFVKQIVMQGTPGDDYLVGYSTNDALDGGAGNDTLIGKQGNDTYVFGRGYGQDAIMDVDTTPGNTDTVFLAADILPTDVSLKRYSNDLYILINGTSDSLKMTDWFADVKNRVENIQFADGTTWDSAFMQQTASTPTDTDDYLIGTPGNDTIDGGGGNDEIYGVEGNDILYGSGGDDNLYGGTEDDVLYGGAGIDNLLGGEGNDTLYGDDGDDNLEGGHGNDYMYGGIGADSLWDIRGDNLFDGGSGDDNIYAVAGDDNGQAGNNTFIINSGGGFDYISVDATADHAYTDTVVFGEGITPEDLVVQINRGSNDGGTGNPMLAIGFGNEEGLVIEGVPLNSAGGGNPGLNDLDARRFVFADGRELTLDQILAMAQPGITVGEQYGTADNDQIHGSIAWDNISGDDGNDIIDGGLRDDYISGGNGNDIIAGNRGNDYIMGDAGSDVFVYNRGDGYDRMATWPGRYQGDIDTISFGVDILPDSISAFINAEGGVYSNVADVCLVIGNGEDRIDIPWFERYYDWSSGTYKYRDNVNYGIARVQFIAEDGTSRVFDLEGIVLALQDSLFAADINNPVSLFTGATSGFELTGTVAPAGGDNAVAYAQTGDLFGMASYYSGGSGDDTINGRTGDDTIDAGDGDNIVDAGEGNNTITAGSGNDQITSGSGNDTITAGNGNNMIDAGDGSNIVNAGTGDDQITTGSGNDVIDAGGGSNLIEAGAGDDMIIGGSGMDVVSADEGSDTLVGGGGNDTLIGGAGDDTYRFISGDGVVTIDDQADASGGNRIVFGAGITIADLSLKAGDDVLMIQVGGNGDNILLKGFNPADAYGPHAVDAFEFADGSALTYNQLIDRGFDLTGTYGADALVGTNAVDRVTALGGNDVIIGGRGDDILDGGSGNDTYIFNMGDGVDVIRDTASTEAGNIVQFGAGIDVTDLALSFDGAALIVSVGQNGDALRLEGFNPNDAYGNHAVETFRFADGSTLSYRDLIDLGININGTAVGDTLIGTSANDSFRGGAGNDVLSGGAGDDSYLFMTGDGIDTIQDDASGQANTLVFGPGIALSDIRLSHDPSSQMLIISTGNGGDSVRLANFDASVPYGTHAVEYFQFADGQVLTYSQLIDRGFDIPGSNTNDDLTGTAAADRITGGAGNDTLAGGLGNDMLTGGVGDDTYLFNRGDGADVIDDVATASSGNTLVFGEGITLADMWRSITFRDDILIIRVGANGDEIHLKGFDPNAAVTGSHAVEYYQFADGTIIDYQQLVQNTFIIQGDTSDDLLSGTNMLDRLYGYEGNDQLVGGAGNDALTGGTGNDELIGGSGDDTYVFNIGDGVDTIQDVPTAVENNRILFGTGITQNDLTFVRSGNVLTIEVGSNGDAINLLNFDPDGVSGSLVTEVLEFADGTQAQLAQMLGLPTDGDDVLNTGSADDVVNARGGNDIVNTDGGNDVINGGSGDDVIYAGDGSDSLTGGSGEDLLDGGAGADTMVGGTGDDIYLVDNAGDLVSENAGEGKDTVISSASYILPDNVENLTLAGDAAIDGTGNSLNNLITGNNFANTLSGGAGSDTLMGGAGDDTLIGGTGTDIMHGGRGDDLYDVDASGDVITEYTGEGIDTVISSASYTLSGNVENLTLTGIEAINATGNGMDNVLTGNGADNILTGDAGNDILLGGTGNDDYAFAAGFGSDVIRETGADTLDRVVFAAGIEASQVSVTQDGNDLLLTVSGGSDQVRLEGWVSDTAKRVEQVLFSDGTAWDVNTLLGKINHVPVVTMPLVNQPATQNALFTFTLPANTFSDADAWDTLSYSATLSDGTALPSWLTFDAATMTFSGTPTNGDVGTLPLKLTATDTSGASASSSFNVIVSDVNDAPFVVTPIASQAATEDSTFTFTVPAGTFADMDAGDTLTYNARLSDGTALPAWLTFDAATMTFSGTPANDNVGTISLKVTAMDSAGASVSSSFNVDVANVNDAPFVVTPIADQSAMEDAAFTFTVATGIFADVDAGDALTYSATLADGTALPSWLSFNASTMTFSGMPTHGDVGLLSLKVTATDVAGASISDAFDITVQGKQNNTITGTDAAETITGTEYDDIIYALAGNDTVYGRNGNDSIYGGVGNDTLYGGAGSDVYYFNRGDGMDAIGDSNGSGTDINKLNFGEGIAKEDLIFSKEGNDLIIRITDTSDGVKVTDWFVGQQNQLAAVELSDGTILTASDVGSLLVNYIQGTNNSDILVGTTGADVINGGAGNDWIFGISGNDTLKGGSGTDMLFGGSGNDKLDGGTGSDIMAGGLGDDTYVVDSASDIVVEIDPWGIDTVQSSVTYTLGANVEKLILTSGGDINGTGNSLNNTLIGNIGNNVLTGNSGKDTLDGSSGNDTLIGAKGSDTYLFRRTDGKDTINDYSTQTAETDTIKMTDGITETEPVIVKQNNDLYLFIDANNYTKVLSQFQNTYNGIERLEVTDGHYITRQDIENIVNTMSSINNDPGMDVMAKFNAMRTDQTYINTLSQSWHQP